MLKELHIKNVAVIDEVRIEFGEGFNVLTGETGAGKSILIDSINLALGSRANRDIIRSGCDFSLVSLCFETNNQAICEAFRNLGIEVEDDLITISRKLGTDGKSVCRINGGIVPVAIIREIAPLLMDIHGQSDNQSLLSPKNHLKYLDEYGSLAGELETYRKEYSEMKSLLKEINSLSIDEEEKNRRFDMLKFQINEIRTANLKAGEDDELIESRERLCNMENIIQGAGTAYGALYGNESGAAFDLLKTAERALSDICRFDNKLTESYERLANVIAETEDIAADINSCLSKTDFSMAELDRIESRLDLINNLKRKYGNTIEEIIAFADKAELDAESIEKSDERLDFLKAQYSEKMAKVAVMAESLSKMRHEVANDLEIRIAEELSALDMPKVKFAIDLSSSKDDENIIYTDTGKDNAEFLISTNPGEGLKPMAKIASGGELSRIMLAIKSVLSAADGADTMIFDEIDTGVSGRAAQKIAEKICGLAKTRQIFSITHLAQIAGMADHHFLIEKDSDNERTSTSVTLLDEKSRIDELARIIGGVTVTDLTRKSAEEMLQLAKSKKGL
ncbi:MAG: DNA repair protein RecN [Clostridia bacterium]|nr:DNA repair protein RecN [Clostridia bacterium]